MFLSELRPFYTNGGRPSLKSATEASGAAVGETWRQEQRQGLKNKKGSSHYLAVQRRLWLSQVVASERLGISISIICIWLHPQRACMTSISTQPTTKVSHTQTQTYSLFQPKDARLSLSGLFYIKENSNHLIYFCFPCPTKQAESKAKLNRVHE